MISSFVNKNAGSKLQKAKIKGQITKTFNLVGKLHYMIRECYTREKGKDTETQGLILSTMQYKYLLQGRGI